MRLTRHRLDETIRDWRNALQSFRGVPGEYALPPRMPLAVWIPCVLAFLAVYLFVFTYVHVQVDIRSCIAPLPDPFQRLIAFDPRWWTVSGDMFEAITVIVIFVLFAQAFVFGDHRPILRWGVGLTIMGVLRASTLLLIPVCRGGAPAGTVHLTTVPMLDLGLFRIPWNMLASTDMVFSGHVGELIILVRATRTWPRWAHVGIWIFQAGQIIGLLATRGHYTVDIILAVPCAYFADRMGLLALARATRAPLLTR